MKKIGRNPIRIPRTKAADQPATRRMLAVVPSELKAFRSELKQDIKGSEARLTSKITALSADMSELKASVHQSNLLVEEQNANNRIVLEGLQALWERQDRIEQGYR